MVLWLPIGLFVVGAFGAYIVCDALDESAAAGFMAFLFFITFFGTAAVVIYGAYFWLKTGQWASISIRDAILWFGEEPNKGLLEPTSWLGIQKVASWYLESNIGWTIFLIPVSVLWILSAASDSAAERRREKGR